MSRYAAAAGIGRLGSLGNDARAAREAPRLIIIGPSGNLVTVPLPSGVAGAKQDDPDELQQFGNSMTHTALAWTRNEIVTAFRNTQSTSNTDYSYAWQPYGQDAGPRVNSANYDPAVSETTLENAAAFDGFNWKLFNWGVGGNRQLMSFKRMPGGRAFWTGPFLTSFMVPKNYGAYEGDDPVFEVLGSESGWSPRSGALGRPGLPDANFSAQYDGDQADVGGVRSRVVNIGAIEQQVNDVSFFRGSIYTVYQHGMIAQKFGGKGNLHFNERLCRDDAVDFPTESNYTDNSRLTLDSTGGSKGRSLAEHGNELFMLSNDGKVHVVLPDTVIQVADLSTLGTPWSSGITGGSMNRTPLSGDGPYPGSNVSRCFITSFNRQLHAFLNFNSSFKVAKGVGGTTGKGVFWATSHDGRNWADRSENLPASGIHSPSGGGVTAGLGGSQVTNWLTRIAPYKFSGFTGDGVTPHFGPSGTSSSNVPRGDFPLAYGGVGLGASDAASGAFAAQPSGFRQIDVPLWTSGNLLDPLDTPFDQLKVPMEFGTVSGALFPTEIAYPLDFSFQVPSGDPGQFFLPSGVGPSGFDYTGCDNYHVSGFVDDQKEVLQIYFSRDFEEGTNLFFELNRASGWNRRNYAPTVKQLNGYVPIMLYDPEIIIPSGGVLDPNPAIDEVSKTATLKYRLYDWPFYDNVDVISEYSLNYGVGWSRIARQKNLSTGSPDTDPSGVIGSEHTLTWNWSNIENLHPLSKNTWYPHVQIRLRAVDPDFDPGGVQ
jgi:hypothetical protein